MAQKSFMINLLQKKSWSFSHNYIMFFKRSIFSPPPGSCLSQQPSIIVHLSVSPEHCRGAESRNVYLWCYNAGCRQLLQFGELCCAFFPAEKRQKEVWSSRLQKWVYERFGVYIEDFRFQPEESTVEAEEPLSAKR